MDARYRVDEDQIAHEILDQEAMVVNLDNGYYYALEGTAVDIWQSVAAGASLPETTAALLKRYTATRAEVAEAVGQFAAELVAEALLVPAEAPVPVERPEAINIADPEPGSGPARPFSLPVMYKYTDMANLIQMDPIREFDETGWPKRRQL